MGLSGFFNMNPIDSCMEFTGQLCLIEDEQCRRDHTQQTTEVRRVNAAA